MKKKFYEEPSIDLIIIDEKDCIICSLTSQGVSGEPDEDPDGEEFGA